MSERIDEARKVARSLLDDLEGQGIAIDAALMKAKRLARLMRDQDAQLWLDLETRGYPSGFDTSKLGTCLQYAIAGGRVLPAEGKYYTQSLPEMEATTNSHEELLGSLVLSKGASTKVKDFIEKNATEALMNQQLAMHAQQRKTYLHHKNLFIGIRAGIHNYVTDTSLAIELGDVAEGIFEQARKAVDNFVRSHCPKAAEKLVAINERMADKTTESFTSALTSCRRLLLDVADAVFPPRETPWLDGTGKQRAVGPEQYKNRLLAYLSEQGIGQSSQEVVATELEHLAARLDSIYEKTCKGVHVDVSEDEATLAVIHTYLFIGEIARYSTS